MNFAKFLRISFLFTDHLRMTASCVYLWILRSFSEHFFYRATLGNCLFHVKVTECQPPDTVKNYFTGAFQAFTRTRSSHHTRTRSSHSKVFIYLKSLKTICEEVILQWSCEKPTCEFTKKKLFHISSFMYFVFIFSECITITSSEEALKVCEHNFFQKL